MPTLIRNMLVACGLALATATLCIPAAAAEPAKKPVKAKAEAKAGPKAKAKAKSPKKTAERHPKAMAVLAEEPEPDITGNIMTDYACELNNKITVYRNDVDPDYIALRWKKRLHRMNRIGTTTGAHRFENVRYGLVWIGIPSKGMLLDSKQGRQLANECKSEEQTRQELMLAQAKQAEAEAAAAAASAESAAAAAAAATPATSQ